MEHFKAGSTISFRLPNDVSKEQLEILNRIREEEGRGFSRKAAQLLLNGLSENLRGKFLYTLMIEGLTDDEKRWLDDEKTKALMGAFVKTLARLPEEALFPLFHPIPVEYEKKAETSKENPSFKLENEYARRIAESQWFDDE